MPWLHSPQVERYLRTVALHQLRQSDEQWREFRRRTRFNWLRTLWNTLIWCVLLPGTVFMAFSFSMPIIGMGVLANRGPRAGQDNGAAIILALHGLQLFGLLLWIAGACDRAYFSVDGSASKSKPTSPGRMSALVHLPMSDSRLLKRKLLELSAGAWMIAIWCAIPYGYLARRFELSLSDNLVAAGLLGIHILSVLCAGVLAFFVAPVRPRRRLYSELAGMAVVLGSILLGFSVHHLAPAAVSTIHSLLYILPTGWVSAACYLAVLEASPSGWSWLAAAAMMIVAALWFLFKQWRAGFSLREYVVSPVNGQWYGVIEKGYRVPATLPPPPPIYAQIPRELLEPPESLSETEARRFVLAANLLVDDPPPALRFVDRLGHRFWSSRDRLLLSVWSSTFDKLTAQWWTLLIGLAAGVLYFLFFAEVPAGRDATSGMFALIWLWLIICCGAARCAFSGDVKSMWTNAIAITLYPVAFDGLSWTSFRCELLRSFAFWPLVAAYGAIAAWLMRNPLWQGVLHGTASLAVLLCAQPLIDCLKLSFHTNDTRRVSMWLLWVGGGIAFFFAACFAALAPSTAWRLTGLGSCALVSGAMWAWYRAAYHRGIFDLLLKSHSD